jgi:PST family polysaccharide transporter
MLPLSAVLFVLAPYLIEALLGPEWLGAIAPFQILIVFSFFRSNAKLCGPLMMAAGKVYRLALIQGGFAASVLVGAWFGSNWGIGGTAFAVAGAFVFQSMILLRSSLQLTGLSWLEVFGSWLRPAGVAFAIGVLTWLLVEGLDSWLSPALVVATTLLTLAVILSIALLAAPRLLLNDDSVQALRQVPRLRALEERLNRKLGRSAN